MPKPGELPPGPSQPETRSNRTRRKPSKDVKRPAGGSRRKQQEGIPVRGSINFGKPRLAKDKAERSRVAQLRRSVPKVAPAGWRDRLGGVRRVSPYEQPATYGCIYDGKGMTMGVMIEADGTVTISLSAQGITPTDAMIATAKEDFFPEQTVAHTSPMQGLVFLMPVS